MRTKRQKKYRDFFGMSVIFAFADFKFLRFFGSVILPNLLTRVFVCLLKARMTD